MDSGQGEGSSCVLGGVPQAEQGAEAGVEFCDSAGLSTLIGLWHAARGAGGSFALAGIPDRLMRLLTLTGLDTVLPLHPTTAEALAAHRQET